MTIKYKPKWIWSMLAFGLAYVAIGVWSIALTDGGYLGGFIVLGAVYIGMFAFRWKRQLATFDGKEIVLHGLPSKRIAYKDLSFSGKLVGDFVFKSEKKEIRFDPKLVDEESRVFLEGFIGGR